MKSGFETFYLGFSVMIGLQDASIYPGKTLRRIMTFYKLVENFEKRTVES